MSEENKEIKNQSKTESLTKKNSKPSEAKQKEQVTKDKEETKILENKLNDSKKAGEKVVEKKEEKLSSVKSKETSQINEKSNTEVKKNEKLSVKPSNKVSKDKTSNRKDSENNESTEAQNELVEKLVSINRVAKVVKGGRRFSFAALVVVGDGNGMVGHGKGKAKEVPEAIKKATDEAKNRMIRVPLRQGRTLHHDIKGRYDAGKVYLRSAPSGTGVIAGGPMRAVFEALGIQDIVAKSVGTSNPHNMVRATFEALKSASSPKIIAMRRGLKINDITKRRKIGQQGLDNGKN